MKAKPKFIATIEMKVIRADGTEQDLGVVSQSEVSEETLNKLKENGYSPN